MPTDANGRVWHAAFAGTVAQNLKPLYTLAEEVGLGEAFIDALQYALRRLQFDPLAFGELIKTQPNSGLVFHARVVQPILFEFAIHEETHSVLIHRVKLLV